MLISLLLRLRGPFELFSVTNLWGGQPLPPFPPSTLPRHAPVCLFVRTGYLHVWAYQKNKSDPGIDVRSKGFFWPRDKIVKIMLEDYVVVNSRL